MILFLFILVFISCKKEETNTPPVEQPKNLVALLQYELTPLPKNPLTWQDNQLIFLDDFQDKAIIGREETSHAIKNFFDAKFRIFKFSSKS